MKSKNNINEALFPGSAKTSGLRFLTHLKIKTMDKNKKAWTVLTPAGEIYVDTASEAYEYKKLYGYIVFRTNTDEEEENKS